MIYFLLPPSPPSVTHRIHQCIHVAAAVRPPPGPSPVADAEPVLVSQSLQKYLGTLQGYLQQSGFDDGVAQKYTSPFAYLHSCPPHHSTPVAQNPWSSGAAGPCASFFRYMELCKSFPALFLAASPKHPKPSPPPQSFLSFVNLGDHPKSQKKHSGHSYGYGYGHGHIPNHSFGGLSSWASAGASSPHLPVKAGRTSMYPNPHTAPTTSLRSFHLGEETRGIVDAIRLCRQQHTRGGAPSSHRWAAAAAVTASPSGAAALAVLPTDQYLTLDAHAAAEWEHGSNGSIREKEGTGQSGGNGTLCMEWAADGTGNLLNPSNFDECCAKYRDSIDLVTATAHASAPRILQWWAQVCYAVCMQAAGGHFVVRIGDCFSAAAVDVLYVLSALYEDVKIARPQTAPLDSSEKYVICQRFRGDNGELFPVLRHSLHHALQLHQRNQTIFRFLHPHVIVPKYFVQRIEEMNAVLGQPQLENLHYTYSQLNKHASPYNRVNDQIVRQNIGKCIQWCNENGIPHFFQGNGGGMSHSGPGLGHESTISSAALASRGGGAAGSERGHSETDESSSAPSLLLP
jgi:hypothetical protein